ncbi:hypothetical protein P8C59_006793 [Phyllachora maydis]|uniref:Galactose oxidase n=1 Tax=Phyllachora maydis TaxID=1825666 RepID=A0AAD9MDK4_9PEZI|nr:hypothetical protein P8C59_006793 [Phyllachora maydis]
MLAFTWSLLAAHVFPVRATTLTLPYTPTTILLLPDTAVWSSPSSRVAYIFAPSETSVDFLAVNISSTLSLGTLSSQARTSGLPFLSGASSPSTTAFTPSIAADGTIAVLAGDCSAANTASLWTYDGSRTGGPSSSSGWTQHATTYSSAWDDSTGEPGFLGGSLAFHAQLAPSVSAAAVYAYGGMCPLASNSSSSSSSSSSSTRAQGSARYSNRMVKVTPTGPGATSSAYTISDVVATAQSPPVAEAGFTFTALAPAAVAGRSGALTQERGYLLLGGHTQAAFVNMSQAALWSLPEETWSFVSIRSPTPSLDSRSGHTAVLTEDGRSLVVLGGWVGDMTQAADPQLLVLHMGEGQSDWRWTVPAGAAQPNGSGIYGHGAAMLPGNVMMVYGGYGIALADGSTSKRPSGSSTGVPLFFNLTSLTWTDEYTDPTSSTTTPTPASSSALSSASPGPSSDARQLGLSLSLGLGLPLLLACVVMAVCLYRRYRHGAGRDHALRTFAQDGSRLVHPADDGDDGDDEMLERDAAHMGLFDAGQFAWNGAAAKGWYTGGLDPYAQGSRSLGHDRLRRGSDGHGGPCAITPLSPLGGFGRSRGLGRGLYQPTGSRGPGYGPGDSGMEGGLPDARTPGGFHPIYEDDEDDDEEGYSSVGPLSRTGDHEHGSDPFVTPSASPNWTAAMTSPELPVAAVVAGRAQPYQHRAQHREVQDWVSDADAADAMLSARLTGSSGPTTMSTPTRPTASWPAAASRRGSNRAGRKMATSPVAAEELVGVAGKAAGGEDGGRTASMLSESGRSAFSFALAERSGSVRSHIRAAFGRGQEGSSESSANTFSTAKSNFASLQAEGPGLLLGGGGKSGGDGPVPSEDDHEYHYHDGRQDDDEDFFRRPGSPSKSKPRRSWFGSLRRVFSGSPGGGGGDDDDDDDDDSRDDSPTRGSLLLEATTGGGMLLRKRQHGREAWAGDDTTDADGEWDIERAVEQRLVQVMFTVPRQRLRVVNAEVEDEEETAVLVSPGGEADARRGEGEDEDEDEDEDEEVKVLSPEPLRLLKGKGKEDEGVEEVADAVKLERPRTRVLDMVESIESRTKVLWRKAIRPFR